MKTRIMLTKNFWLPCLLAFQACVSATSKNTSLEKVFALEKVNSQVGGYLRMVKTEVASYSDGFPDSSQGKIDSAFARSLDSARICQSLFEFMSKNYTQAEAHLRDLGSEVNTAVRKRMDDSLTPEFIAGTQDCMQTIEQGTDPELKRIYDYMGPMVLADTAAMVYSAIQRLVYVSLVPVLKPLFRPTSEQFQKKVEDTRNAFENFARLGPCITLQKFKTEKASFFKDYGISLHTKDNVDFESLKSRFLADYFNDASKGIRGEISKLTTKR